MNAENETWNEGSQEEEKKNAGHSDDRSSNREGTTRRDDNRYPVKKENNYRREGGVEHPQRQGYSREGFSQRGERPNYNNSYNKDANRPPQRGERPSYNTGYNKDGNRPPQRGERPSYSTNYNRDGNRSPQREERPGYNNSYNRDANRPPYQSNDNRESNNRPQHSYNQGERPWRNNNSNEERKPWQKNTGNESSGRPRFQRTNNADGHSSYNTNYRNEGEGRPSYNKPRYAPDDDNRRSQSFSRPVRRTADYNSNDKYSKKKQIEYKLQFVDPNEPIRLNKYLANAGVCSRRQADEYITAGVVTVNDVVMTELGTKIKRDDTVKFHDEKVSLERKVYVLLNKPKDCVTTSDDPQARLTVLDLVKGACNERIYPVGRLDRNTTGVLLLTNDGDLVSKLTHPQFLKKKVYYVSTNKNVTKQDMEKIASGIQLEDGEIHADKVAYTDEISLKEFIEKLTINEEVKEELRNITPHTYTGI
ncbi:Ribosomal large subunit pseudouridine synthase B [termite gut metagenome]|uniref:Ribosomal large subunit pseudouridine synthase B n=1 Tax=termite gut metagenome TaxID=433724 RepID=A0A5J4S0I2_9ZZZZ